MHIVGTTEQHPSDVQLAAYFRKWRNDLQQELHTNASGLLAMKYATITIPHDFPDLSVLHAYLSPITSSTEGHALETVARQDPNISELAKFAELHFGWNDKAGLLKHFESLLWPGVVTSLLRHTVLFFDELALLEKVSKASNLNMFLSHEFAVRASSVQT